MCTIHADKPAMSVLRAGLAMLLGGALNVLGGCNAPPPKPELTTAHAGEAASALTPEQCLFYDVNGKNTICHYTGSGSYPYTIVKTSEQGCINGHAGHAEDYVAVGDPNCQGGGCLADNGPCDATLPCCEGLVCSNGVCKNLCAGVTCTANDQCHVAGTCDPNTGACSNNPAAPDGTACTDGDACTQTDTCQAGVCTGRDPVTCTASDECHVAGSCDMASGVCSNPNAPDGIYCSTGVCKGGAPYKPTLGLQAKQDYGVNRYPEGVAAGDVNGDGKVDLVVTNNGDANASVLLGNGDGTFMATGAVSVGQYPAPMALSDLDGDGKLDLVVGGFNIPGVGGLRVLLGNGDGTFQAATLYAVGNQPFGVVVADLNSDGKLDLATANYVGSSVSVLLGNGDGTFQGAVSYSSFVSASTPSSIAAVDVNGDGKFDLVTANYNSNNVGVWFGNGDGTFQPVVTFAPGGSGAGAAAVGDVNRDGKPDIVVANQSSGNVSVLLGNGDGTFQAPVLYAVGNVPVSVQIGDLNGDLRPDIAITIGSDNKVGVLLGNGDGTFLAVATFPTSTFPYGFAEADLNGDGKLDIAVANLRSNSVSVLINLSF